MPDLYARFPFIPQNKLDLLDTFVGNGVQTGFTLVRKSTTFMAASVQAGTLYYSRYNNGYTINNSSTFTFSTAPANGAQIVVPGVSTLVFTGYDQSSVPGVTGSANVIDVPFYLADDGSTIASTTYLAAPGQNGIALFFSNQATAAGAQTSWSQLSCADASGNIIGYAATGTTLYVGEMFGFTTLSASAAAGATTFVVNAASAITTGDYIWVNLGNGTQENVKVTNVSGSTITIGGFNYDHFAGETVFVTGRKYWARITIPINALGGIPGNLINLGLGYTATQASRL